MGCNIFLISDTHFGHENCWAKFKLDDGVTPLRPFTSTEEMDEAMIRGWNETVRPSDHVYHLGDFAMDAARYLKIAERLMGQKFLVLGNHDKATLKEYAQYFSPLPFKILDKYILTHIPIHPCSVGRWRGNFHGHLHDGCVRNEAGHPDKRYACLSVERIGYRPIAFEEAKKLLN